LLHASKREIYENKFYNLLDLKLFQRYFPQDLKHLSFLPRIGLSQSTAHGGDIGRGKRKIARPFDPRRPMHLVLRSSRATGEWSFLRPRHRDRVDRLIARIAAKYGIRVHLFANVGNHLHLLVSMDLQKVNRTGALPRIGQTHWALDRTRFSSFLRELAGAIAFAVTGAGKTRPVGRFWDGLAFSRVLHWGRDLESARRYAMKNLFEAAGLWNRKKHPDWELFPLTIQPG
jgi:hypothetical protein